jgi:hypothetical protein
MLRDNEHHAIAISRHDIIWYSVTRSVPVSHQDQKHPVANDLGMYVHVVAACVRESNTSSKVYLLWRESGFESFVHFYGGVVTVE